MIKYTKHAKKKFFDLSELGVKVSKSLIAKIIKDPLSVDTKLDAPKIIVSGDLDKRHILRIVYRKEDDIIVVITFYPARKGRYL